MAHSQPIVYGIYQYIKHLKIVKYF